MNGRIYHLTAEQLEKLLIDAGFITADEIIARLDNEIDDAAFQRSVNEPDDDDTPYVGEDSERADAAYDQWLHDMGQGA